MSIELANVCKFPHDLDAAAFALGQQLGDRMTGSFNTLTNLEKDIPDISAQLDEGTLLLNRILANGDGTSTLKNTADIAKQFGLPGDTPSQEESEKRAKLAGITLVKGAVYVDGAKSKVAGDADNIEVLRRLYFASGRSLTRVEELLKVSQSFVVHMQLGFINAPAKSDGSQYTTSELVDLYNLSYLDEDNLYIYNGGGTAIILTQDYLAVNQSLGHTKKQFGLNSFNEITSSVFHYNTVDNSSATTQRFREYGYANSELNAILQGDDLANLPSNPVQQSIDSSLVLANGMVATIDFVLSRFSTLSAKSILGSLDPTNQFLQEIKTKLLSEIATLKELHLGTISKALFQVTIIIQKDTLDKLRKIHTDSEIIYLLEKRKDVLGISFEADDAALQKSLSSGMSGTVGSNLLSNKFLNNQPTSVVNMPSLVKMLSDLEQAEVDLKTFTETSLAAARRHLIDFGATSAAQPVTVAAPSGFPIVSAPVTPSNIVQGQPSMETPTSILFQYMSFEKTFQIKIRLGAVDAALASLNTFYTDKIAKPIAAVINLVAGFFENAMKICSQLMDKARNAILPLKQKMDSFFSKYLSLTGSGTFDSSLLKCAINFDLGLSFNLLDDLLALISKLGNLVSSFIGKFTKWLVDLIEKILCIPFNLLNSFLGNMSVSLPGGCQIPGIDLGPDLTSALTRLRNVSNIKNTVFSAFSSDLVRYKAIVKANPDKMLQFNSSAACSSNATSTFYNASMLNINEGIL